jgi:hypothetical protein
MGNLVKSTVPKLRLTDKFVEARPFAGHYQQ